MKPFKIVYRDYIKKAWKNLCVSKFSMFLLIIPNGFLLHILDINVKKLLKI